MDSSDIQTVIRNAVDGQSINVSLASGRVIEGIYNAEATSYEAGLHFDSLDGKPLRASWDNVADVTFRSARATAGRMFVPDGHPASQRGPVSYRSDGTPLRPHTTRNR